MGAWCGRASSLSQNLPEGAFFDEVFYFRGGGGGGALFRAGDIISGLYIPWPEVVVPENVPLVDAEGVQKNRAESMGAECAVEETAEEDVDVAVRQVRPPILSSQIWRLYSREANRVPDSIKFPKMHCIP